MDVLGLTELPILAVFGERDTQVDPLQGVEAYQQVLKAGGQPHSRVELFPAADHNIVVSETGCMKERQYRSRLAWRKYAPGYLDLMEEWLRTLEALLPAG